jgi:cardiolipin synthase A/B
VESFAENLVDGHRTLPALLADLERARTSIHVSMFLFFNDPIGQEVAEALCARARAGVTVRVLVNMGKTQMGDPFSTGEREMMRHDPTFREDALDVGALVERMRGAGVKVLDTNIDLDREPATGDPRLLDQARLIRETSRMDAAHVDHRKLVVVDGRVGYCGSANVGAQYLFRRAFDPRVEAKGEAARALQAGAPEPWWKWHDGLVRFEGPIVADLEACFRERWVLDGGDDYRPAPPAGAGGDGVPRGVRLADATLFKNQPDSTPNPVRRLFLECIAAARDSIFIENPYVYHPAIIAALLAARRSRPSLQATLVLPGMAWNDSEFSQDAMQHHYAALLEAGVAVHEYQNHFTHLKLATFDERISIVGSPNLNFRSLEDDTDFEAAVRIEGEEFARKVNAEVRDVDVRHSRRIAKERLSFRERVRDPRTLLLVQRRLL